MNHLNRMGLLFCLISLLASVSSGHAAPKLISYDEVLAAAMRESPLVRIVDSQVTREAADGVVIGTMSNPDLSLEVRPYVGRSANGRDTEYEATISQPLRLSNFAARTKVAELIQKASSVERKIKLREFEQTILLSYGKAWLLQEKERFTEDSRSRARSLTKQIAVSAKHGLVPESTQKLLVAEEKKLAVMLKAIAGDKSRAEAELTRLTGILISDWKLSPLVFAPLSSNIHTDLDKSLPLTERLRLRAELGRAQSELARLDAFPRFAPRIGYEHTSDGDDRLNIGFTMELPFSDRNQALRMQHSAQASAASAEYTYLKDGRLAREIQLLMSGAKASEEQANVFRVDVLPAINAALLAAERELAAGQGNPIFVWQILLELTSSQDRYLELWMKALSERAELSILLGENI